MLKSLTLFWGTGILSFTVYLNTLAPTITWRNDGVDSGDLATAVAVNGVPHPSGYPTYLLLGQLFRQLPFNDIAYRLNLLSAACAALTVAIIALVVYRTLSTPANQAWIYAASAALVVAFAPPFWSQAVITEVYTLTTLFAALLLYISLQIQNETEAWCVLILSGLLGLSLGNHLSILLFFPMLVELVKVKWSGTLLIAAFVFFFLGLSVYLIIPWRAAALPPVNWGGATTWPNFVWLVSAAPYRHFLFSLPWEYVPARIIVALHLLAEALVWVGFPVSLLGVQHLRQVDPALAWRSIITVIGIFIYAIGYNTTDSYIYLLPALLIFALWLGWGLAGLTEMLQAWVPNISRYKVGLLLLPLIALILNFSDQDLSQDQTALRYAQQSLESVASDAIIIVNDDPHTFALWYGRYGLNLRPDVTIINGNLLSYTWYRQNLSQTYPHLYLKDESNQPLTTIDALIKRNLTIYPIYSAMLEPPQLDGYIFVEHGPLHRLSKRYDQ